MELVSFSVRSIVALLLLLMMASAHADQPTVDNGPGKGGDKEQTTNTERTTIEGDALWIEEKINPATRWVEKLVRPVTGWIEDKIQHHEEMPLSSQPDWTPITPAPLMGEESLPSPAQTPGKSQTPGSPQPPDSPVISTEKVVEITTSAFPGDVLRVKYLPKENPVYRVKLISKQGEIYILYVNARTGEILN